MYASVNEARFTVKQWCRTYSQLFLIHYAADIIVEIFPCASSVAILRTFHNSPTRQRFFELVLDVYISEPHVKKNKRPL